MIKVCKICNESKELSDFYVVRKNNKSGVPTYSACCRPCYNLRTTNTLKNKPKEERQRVWKQNNQRLRKSGYDKSYRLKRRYGISIEDYDAMLIEQKGGCAICQTSLNLGGKKLSVDHCHKTQRVRGLLCTPCNTALGLLKEDKLLLSKAIDYLEHYE